MLVLSVLFSLFFYLFFFTFFHSLIVLLFVEVFVLCGFLFLLFSSYSWFFVLVFLLVCVCVGAYGVRLFVSTRRRKGVDYFLSF